MFRAITYKVLSFDLPYRSDFLLDKSTILRSPFFVNGFILKGELLVKILDKF